eukprot:TRINITY_DN10822_c0_g1_i2.p2 TRINITY_DN10822_c0_g1~~TRINITY_DN10822_c0_g1_i2.p2  ORF type:complete len:168 (+),score=23.05 TRINITY_DN10822_c0_g1_i2:75-506(+)
MPTHPQGVQPPAPAPAPPDGRLTSPTALDRFDDIPVTADMVRREWAREAARKRELEVAADAGRFIYEPFWKTYDATLASELARRLPAAPEGGSGGRWWLHPQHWTNERRQRVARDRANLRRTMPQRSRLPAVAQVSASVPPAV